MSTCFSQFFKTVERWFSTHKYVELVFVTHFVFWLRILSKLLNYFSADLQSQIWTIWHFALSSLTTLVAVFLITLLFTRRLSVQTQETNSFHTLLLAWTAAANGEGGTLEKAGCEHHGVRYARTTETFTLLWKAMTAKQMAETLRSLQHQAATLSSQIIQIRPTNDKT